MLRKDKQTPSGVTCSGLPQLSQLWTNFSRSASVELKSSHRMPETFRHQRKHRPPITGRAGRRPRLRNGINALAKDRVIHLLNIWLCLIAAHLS
jgi:hypothetical protein